MTAAIELEPVINDPAESPPDNIALTTVGAAVPTVTAEEFILTAVIAPTNDDADIAEMEVNPVVPSAAPAVGAALNAVNALVASAEVDAIVPVITVNPRVPELLKTDAEPDAVWNDPADRPLLTPVPE